MSVPPGPRATAAVALGAVVASAGGSVLAAHVWGLQPADPTQLWPLGMVFNTALAFLLAGLALVFASRQAAPALVQVFAAGVLLLGAVSLLQVISGVSLGIDQLLWRVPTDDARASPGRMAPAAALTFAVFGTAILVRMRWPRVLAATLVVIVSGWALVILGGLDLMAGVAGVPAENRFPNAPQLPWFSALLVLACGLGLLELGGWRHASRLLLIRPALGAGVLMLLVGTVLAHLSRAQERIQARRTVAALASGVGGAVVQQVRTVYGTLQTAVAAAEQPGVPAEAWANLVEADLGEAVRWIGVERRTASGDTTWRAGAIDVAAAAPPDSMVAPTPGALIRSVPDPSGRWPRPIVVARVLAGPGDEPIMVRLAWDAHAALDTLVRSLALEPYAVDIRFGQASLFRNAHAELIRPDGWLEERVLAGTTTPVVLRFWPTPAALAGQRTGLPILIQTVACALAILIALGLHYLRLAQRRAKELERAHVALEASQARLREAERLEAVGQLAGGVAHEFNNILTSIRGYTTAAIETLPPAAPARAELQEVLTASARATELTGRLLAVGQRQLMMPKRLHLADLVAGAVQRIRSAAGVPIRIAAGVGGERATVMVDPVRFEDVLAQLVRNAATALGGRGELEVATGVHVGVLREPDARPQRPAGTYYWVEIRDEGPGMDAATLAGLLEPFRTLQPRPGGHAGGLGLAAVFGMVAQSGGALGIRSAPGQGTVVRVYLPEAAAVESGGEAPTLAAPPASHPLVLVVEDEAPIRNLAVRALRGAGYEVHEAADAEAALDVLGSLPRSPSLVITDVLMPGMQGGELAERIRAEAPGTPVLFISGYAADQLSAQGIALAGAGFLQKPFGLKELLAQVARLAPRPDADAATSVP